MKKNSTQLSYRALLFLPLLVILSSAYAGGITLPAVSSSIIFTAPIQNNNMFLGVENNPTQEGYTLPAVILGSPCQEIPAGKFMYSYSSRTAVPTSASSIIISITYYDSSMNSIWVNYTRNGNAGGWGTADFQKSNTQKWITRIITITDAGLDGSMGYGGDIRMGFSGDNNYIKDISISVGTLDPTTQPIPAKPNNPGSEFMGKSFAGYQLWHQAGATPQDWLHWSYGMLPAAGRGNHNTETFPHIADYNGNPNVTMYPTNFANLGDGTPTKLYNSTDQGVIDVQMSLLKNAGFDGVAIQRNAPIGRALKASADDYCVSIKNACENNGRLFYIMYCMPDTNNGSAHLEDVVAGIERDWVFQMEQVYALTSSGAYATVNGKPVVELWGLGYSTIEVNNPQALELAAFFKARGCYVIAGTPRDWRLMNEGSRTDFANVYKAYDMISPWTVGAYNDTTSADNYKTNYEVADKAYCDANGMGYYPVVFVGSAWSQPVSGYPNDTKRIGGKFLWEQARNAQSIGVQSMYFAMLDEFEESTDIINAATDYFDIPTDQYFGTLAMDGIWCSPDYYLRLGGAAARMLTSGASPADIPIPYSLGPIYYRNSFESRVANCIINGTPENIVSPIDACFYHDGVITNTAVTSPSVAIVNPAAGLTESGIYSTQITGNATGASKYYYQVSETKIAVKANMQLSFWKYSANTLGQNTSVDLIFKSGKTLHGLPAYTDNNGNAMTPTVARGTVGTWQKFNCQIGKGELIGDEIDGIAIAYDNPAASGNFNAYFDDIIIEDAPDTTTTATSIFITYSNPLASNNLTQYTVTDPGNEPYTFQTTIGGLDCIEVPGSKYAYYNVNDTAITSTQNDLIFTITYFDEGTDNIAFQYNATGGSNYTGMNIQKTGTNTWITATIAVTDASLRNAQNNGCDFRIGTTTGYTNYIRNITITTGTLDPATEPVPVTTGSAYSEFKGKSIAGYQAWFTTGNASSGWFHWAGGAPPAVNNLSFEVYPDTRDYAASDLTNTDFANLGNGDTSKLFNSADSGVINTHFDWMKTAGIDGVAVQRFINGIGSVINNSPAATLLKIKTAAEANNKIFYICYDISSTGLDSTWEDIIKFDWVYNIEKNYALTGSPAYATVNGKPVVEIWGAGFTGDHPGTEAQTIDLINFLKARGCYVIGGVPTYWRTETNDSKPDFLDAYKAFDMISPWSVGRFGDSTGAASFKNNLIIPDKAYTDGLGIDYLPVIFPGFSWSQWNNATANVPNAIPRSAGSFWWQQALNIKSAGINSMYFAMFDEYDEGTAIMKAATDYTMIPTDQYFVTTSADGIWTSSDFYLRLAAAGTQLLKGTQPVSATVPIPYSQGPVYYRNSFEKRYTVYNANGTPGSGTGYFNIDPCFYNDGVITNNNVTSGTATINNIGSGSAKTGLFAAQITGTATAASGTNNYYYQISQTKIAVKANMELSFWKNSVNTLGQYSSVDLAFKSGKTLRSLSEYTDNNGNVMQPTVARGAVGTWQNFICQIGKGELIGDTIVGISIGYDHPAATGTFTAYFDDVIIQDALDTTTVSETPYGGTAWPIPGTIQSEDYDNGGQGVAYNDSDPTNDGGQYRTTEGVDVETCSDAGGGYDVGYTNGGEWEKYTVNVNTAGVYTLEARVASNSAGNSFHVEIDGSTIGTIAVPNTTGFQTWQTVSVTTPSLTAGQHVMRIYMETGGFNLNYVTFVLPTTIPVISSVATASGTEGTAITNYTITASNTPTSFAVTNLPAGLSLNTTTGIISGTPTVVGIFVDTLKATNASGTGTQVLTITIAGVPTGCSTSMVVNATSTPIIDGTVDVVWNNAPKNIIGQTISGTIQTGSTWQAMYDATNLYVLVQVKDANLSNVGTNVYDQDGVELFIAGDNSKAGAYTANDHQYRFNWNEPATIGNITGNTGTTTGITYAIPTSAGGYTLEVSIPWTTIGGSAPYNGKPIGFDVNLNDQQDNSGAREATAGWYLTNNDDFQNTAGFGTVNLTVCAATAPVINSAITASGTVNTSFSYNITATNTPTGYSVGGALPGGLTLNATTGAITGTPSIAGTFIDTIKATNAGGTGTQVLTIVINPANPIVTSATLTGTVGTAFNYTIVATNTPTNYGSTALPAGLILDPSTGIISGTPTTAGTYTITDTAKNAGGIGTGTVTITINPAKPVVAATSTTGTIGTVFSYTIFGTNTPTSYGSTALPAGLILDPSTGIISGTPTTAGTFSVTDTAKNISGAGNGTLTIVINPARPVVANASTTGTVGTTFSYTIFGTNTPTSYGSTALPAGLTLDPSTGIISGTPTTAGTFTVTDTAKNISGAGNGTLTIVINPTKPVVATASTTGTVGTVFSYTISATNTPTSYGSTALPAGLTLNPSTGIISGTPIAAGTFTVTDTAKNISGAGNGTLTIVINPAKPVVANASTSGTVGTTFSYTISATNNPTSYGSTTLPAGLALDPSTGVISGTPTTAGTYTITDTAKNISGAGNGVLTIVINPAKPIVTSTTVNGTTGTAFSYTIAATNNPTSYGVSALPTGLIFDAVTGTISGTPTAAGTFTIADTAKNISGNGTGTLTIVITTVLPPVPVVTSDSVTGTVGVTFNYSISATNSPTGFSSTSLPVGLSLNSSGVISGIPTTAGTYTITDTAKNAGGIGTGTLTITINPAKPVVATASTSGTVGTTFSYTVSGTNTPTSYGSTTLPAGLALDLSTGVISGIPTTAGTFTVTDTAKNISGAGNGALTIVINPAKPVVTSATINGTTGTAFSYTIAATNNPTSYGVSALPTGLIFDAATGTISGTPTAAGTFTIADTAKNISGNGTGTLTIVITTVLPPVPVVTSGSVTGTVGVTFNYSISATNSPTDFSSTSLPAGLSLNSSGVISGIPTTAGTYTITDTAKNAGGIGTGTLTITINPAKPVVATASTTGIVGTTFSYTIAATNTPTSYGSTTLPAGLTLNPSTGIISGTPTTAGTFTVTDTAKNISGAGNGVLTILINPAKPVVATASTTGIVGTTFSYTIAATNTPTSYGSTTLPADLTLNPSTGIISGTPIAAGTFTVTDTAKNISGAGNGTLIIVINPAKPVVANASTSGTVGTTFSYTISATNNPTSYSSTTLPAGLTLNPSTGIISGTPIAAGTFTVTDTAKNISGAGNGTLTIIISSAQITPVITSAVTATGTVAAVFNYSITATNTPTIFGVAGVLPAGLSINAAGVISGTPTVSGTFVDTLKATNAAGTGKLILTITINSLPGVPLITSDGSVSGIVGESFEYDITATNSPTSYGATNLPAGLSINTATGEITGIPTSVGTSKIAITATNASGSKTNILTVMITAPPVPVISSADTATATEGEPFTYTIEASNLPTNYTATGLPQGLTIDPVTGIISGTPIVSGTFNVTLTVTNSFGTDTMVVAIKVVSIAVAENPKLMPNPVTDGHFMVTLPGWTTGESVNIAIRNFIGMLVQRGTAVITDDGSIGINVPGLIAGNYVIIIMDANKKAVKKFTVK